jgi:hypothetical protein
MVKDGKQILDISAETFKIVLGKAKNFSEALNLLGIYYCSNSITRVRTAAKIYNIDITHLDKRSRKSIDEAEAQRVFKIKKRNSLNKRMRNGSVEDYSYFILYDSRGNDKKYNRENNLTLDFIRKILIDAKCSYCDTGDCRLTLDRINNNLGHTTDNVVVSCLDCNVIRNNIPYEAWLHIAPSVKSAKELGLFEGWSKILGKKNGNQETVSSQKE